MPDEYISLAKALADFEACNAENPRWTPQRVKTLLLRQPAADVAEGVHGVGAESDVDTSECSCCNAVFDLVCLEPDDFRYCPHCGAKMDGGYER